MTADRRRRRLRIAFVVAFAAASIAFFLFYRMYRHDVATLSSFSSAYARFDAAISGASGEKPADALRELLAVSKERLSSLIKNDRLLMDQMRFVADIAAQELTHGESLERIQRRKSAFDRFRELAE